MAGFLFLTFATFFLPVIVIRPHKFALLMTLGNLCIWLAIAFLRGPYEQFKELTALNRLPFTILFGGSIVMTFFASMKRGGYMQVVFYTVVQIAALLWYILSYFPGGSSAMWYTSKIVYHTARGYMTVMFAVGKQCAGFCIARVWARMAG